MCAPQLASTFAIHASTRTRYAVHAASSSVLGGLGASERRQGGGLTRTGCSTMRGPGQQAENAIAISATIATMIE